MLKRISLWILYLFNGRIFKVMYFYYLMDKVKRAETKQVEAFLALEKEQIKSGLLSEIASK